MSVYAACWLAQWNTMDMLQTAEEFTKIFKLMSFGPEAVK